jgi:SAM-dependent methyltransferase
MTQTNAVKNVYSMLFYTFIHTFYKELLLYKIYSEGKTMSTENPWQNTDFAHQYAVDVGDPNRGWYEHEVNGPSIINLIPQDAIKILDFGCGPGDFTALLAKQHEVDGCDNSAAMLDIAHKNHPDIQFFEWDISQQTIPSEAKYDAVVSKLAVQFIKDLDSFATAISKTLRQSGNLIISVPHPAQTAKQVPNYWKEHEYRQQIGKYGIYDMMVHRSLERYITVLAQSGFVLAGLSEPSVSDEQLRKHSVSLDDFLMPKRLNLRLQLHT